MLVSREYYRLLKSVLEANPKGKGREAYLISRAGTIVHEGQVPLVIPQLMDEAGEEQKFAFVTYQKAEDAKVAVEVLHEVYRFREMSAEPIQCSMVASSSSYSHGWDHDNGSGSKEVDTNLIASYSSAAAHGEDPVQTEQGKFIGNAVQSWLKGSAGLETDSEDEG